jgi:hypothetical protein
VVTEPPTTLLPRSETRAARIPSGIHTLPIRANAAANGP